MHQAHERWPSHLPLAIAAARASIATENYQGAVEILEPVKDGADAEVLRAVDALRADALLRLGKTARALSILEPLAVRAFGQHEYTVHLQLYNHALIDLGRTHQAESYLEAASTWTLTRSQHAHWLVERARLSVLQGHGEQAIEELSEAIALRPDPHLRVFRGLVQVWLGKSDAAETEFSSLDSGALRSEYASLPTLIELLVRSDARFEEASQAQIERFPEEQAGYLLAAAHCWRNGRNADACWFLQQGRNAARSSTLLRPPWLRKCDD